MFAAVFSRTSDVVPKIDEFQLAHALRQGQPSNRIRELRSDHAMVWAGSASAIAHTPDAVGVAWTPLRNTRSDDDLDRLLDPLFDGPRAVNALRGPFASAAFDPIVGLVAARDHLGLRPLYYTATNDWIVVTTAPATLRAIEGVAEQPSRQWLARYLAGLSIITPSTPWHDVRLLPPGHILRWRPDTNNAPELERFHRFDPSCHPVSSDDDRWIQAYRHRLEASVSNGCQPAEAIGFEVSGGIDSSTLPAIATHLPDCTPTSVQSLGFCTMERESAMIRLVNRHLGIEDEHLFWQREVADDGADARRIIDVLGHPPEHNAIYGHRALYERCETLGIRTLFSGFGGDEAVTSQAGQALSELGPRRARAARRTLDPSLRHATHSFLKELTFTLPPRAQKRLDSVVVRQWSALKIADSVAAEFDLEALHRARLEPMRNTTVNGQACARLELPMLAKRAGQTAVVAASYGVDAQWPLLDVDLIAQWLRTPTDLKRRHGYGRYLHRRAIEDLLPDVIVWNRRKSMGARTHPTPTDHEYRARRLADELIPALASMVDIPAFIAQARALDAAPTRAVTTEWVGHWQVSNALLLANVWLTRFHTGWTGR